jgi:hypothetical protein
LLWTINNTLRYTLAKTALKLDGNTIFSSNFVNHKRQRNSVDTLLKALNTIHSTTKQHIKIE